MTTRPARNRVPKKYRCRTWSEVVSTLRLLPSVLQLQSGEDLWFRGANCSSNRLLPSLLWRAATLTDTDLNELEQDLFFEFQARARELHEKRLTDWDYLFFMRHHGVPTRILDWTDSFGSAVYFALEDTSPRLTPCIWALNPYALNEQTWLDESDDETAPRPRDLVQPKYITYVDDEFWDYGEALLTPDDWPNDGPVAIYPLQISERMRAQRGWFTFHGNDRRPLDAQYPNLVVQLQLADRAVAEGREFLGLAGLKPYSIYPDLDHLADELLASVGQRTSKGRVGRRIMTSSPRRISRRL